VHVAKYEDTCDIEEIAKIEIERPGPEVQPYSSTLSRPPTIRNICCDAGAGRKAKS
jgi:hypothetical protein